MIIDHIPCSDLKPGDVYLVRTSGGIASRTVLEVISTGTMMGTPAALLEVRDEYGTAHRENWHGTVDRVQVRA